MHDTVLTPFLSVFVFKSKKLIVHIMQVFFTGNLRVFTTTLSADLSCDLSGENILILNQVGQTARVFVEDLLLLL